ncbi:hypothetical protein POPTR_001G032200v4 [Populus trichocarpa]|uniref:Uncharacterized protein n=1 Tax=Populus trichocarpa TaxID=3694 RepID=A0A3N7E732_POPTR|nr:hypothetical protein POPTR_001G032200v4 [Populus trichocarpa]
MLSANTCTLTSKRLFKKYTYGSKRNLKLFTIRASSDDSDCNTEECAPEKEVGMVSLEWLAGEKTKVVGTFPPRARGWTGYVEKDTAGQTDIYSVEPAVYVAESAISSFLLLLVGKSPSDITTAEYNGPWPSLSYYINKFKPAEIIQAAVPSLTESIHAESSTPDFSKKQIQSAPEVSEIQVQSQYEPEPSTTSVSSVSLAN